MISLRRKKCLTQTKTKVKAKMVACGKLVIFSAVIKCIKYFAIREPPIEKLLNENLSS